MISIHFIQLTRRHSMEIYYLIFYTPVDTSLDFSIKTFLFSSIILLISNWSSLDKTTGNVSPPARSLLTSVAVVWFFLCFLFLSLCFLWRPAWTNERYLKSHSNLNGQWRYDYQNVLFFILFSLLMSHAIKIRKEFKRHKVS